MTEWLCTECLSLNGRRADRCYRCRTPRVHAEAIEGVREPKRPSEQADVVKIGVPVVVKGAPPYRSGRQLATAAAVLIVAATIVTIVHYTLTVAAARPTLIAPEPQVTLAESNGQLVLVGPDGQPLSDAAIAALENSVPKPIAASALTDFGKSPLGILTGAIALDPNSNSFPLALSRLVQLVVVGAAIVVWGLWLARAVENVPALGGGWPSLTPAWAFVLSLLPGVNLLRPAGLVREIYERIPGRQGAGSGLVSAWWVALLLGAVLQVPRLATSVFRWILSIVLFLTSASPRDQLRTELILGGVGVVLSVVAAVLAIRVVLTLQARLEERAASMGVAVGDAAARASAPPPTPPSAPPAPPTEPAAPPSAPSTPDPAVRG